MPMAFILYFEKNDIPEDKPQDQQANYQKLGRSNLFGGHRRYFKWRFLYKFAK